MRVALISPGFPEYAAELARTLAVEHDVLFVTERQQYCNELGRDPSAEAWPSNLTLQVVDHEPSIFKSLRNAWALIAAVRDFSPDVLHLQETTRDYAFVASVFFRAVPLVVTVHDPTPHSGSDARRMKGRFGRYLRAYRDRADAAIVHGKSLAEDLVGQWPRLTERTHVVPHGVLGVWGAPPASPTTGSGRVLMLGRMEDYKGVTEFVQAVGNLQFPGAIGVLAGRGPALDVEAPNLETDRFEVHNRYVSRADVIALFDAADCVLLPYRDGTQSGVALLAIGRHRPIVSTNVGALGEVVRAGENGLLTEPGDVMAMTQAVDSILADERLRQRLSGGAGQLASEELSWVHVASLTSAVYSAVAAPG